MPKPPGACRQMRLAVIPSPYSLPFQCRPESEPGPVLPGIPLPGRLYPGLRRNNKHFNDTPWSDKLPDQPPAGYRAGG